MAEAALSAEPDAGDSAVNNGIKSNHASAPPIATSAAPLNSIMNPTPTRAAETSDPSLNWVVIEKIMFAFAAIFSALSLYRMATLETFTRQEGVAHLQFPLNALF